MSDRHDRLRQDITRRCWRIAAIYRSCLRFGKDRSWASEKLSGLLPDAVRDEMVANWFTDMAELQQRYRALKEEAAARDFIMLAA